MAKWGHTFKGDFDTVLEKIERGILGGSSSASLEDFSDFRIGSARCSVRVFERYSFTGSNRVSLNVTLFQSGENDELRLSAITSGGSQVVFFKINTIGEEAFLDKLREIL